MHKGGRIYCARTFIVGGENYNQGSSREHAALAPRYLGVKAVIAKSFARIHLANLVNFGIILLTFVHRPNYGCMAQGDPPELDVKALKESLSVKNITNGIYVRVKLSLSDREKDVIKAGGKLAAIRSNQVKE